MKRIQKLKLKGLLQARYGAIEYLINNGSNALNKIGSKIVPNKALINYQGEKSKLQWKLGRYHLNQIIRINTANGKN